MAGGRIPRAFIDDLLARVDIVDLIDRSVPLKKTGANYVARCPFHTEKTPSFSVNRAKQFYHCFGCGVSGNAISFLMEFNHLDFAEAVEDLASFAGIEVVRESFEYHSRAPATNAASDLYTTLERVALYYQDQLLTHPDGKRAFAYLQARGVSGNVTRDYMLGFAPMDWKELIRHYNPQWLSDAGVLGRNENGDYFARFRGRLMFPIRDKRGRVIGFGGRALGDYLPKYLNSPETLIFQKGKELYGLYELLKKQGKPKKILVVEGYLDTIALAQHGIDYAVATLGTATSQAHLELLFRFTSELVFCFDGDNAGRDAAWKAISAVFPVLKGGRQIRIMLLPAQHDPDSIIREEGANGFSERIDAAQALSEYFFEHFSRDLKLSEMESRSQLKNEAEAYLQRLPLGSFREMMFDRLSLLAKRHISDNVAILAYKQQEKQHRVKTGRPSLPSIVMALLLQNPEFIEIIEQYEIDWSQLKFEGIEKFISILAVIAESKPGNFGKVLELFRNNSDEELVMKLSSLHLPIPEEGLEAEFSGALSKLIKQGRSDALERLLAKEKSEGLNTEDKELLRKLLAAGDKLSSNNIYIV